MKISILAAMLSASVVSSLALASDPSILGDGEKQKVLSAIKTRILGRERGNLSERLAGEGFKADSVMKQKVDKKSEIETTSDRLGDVHYTVNFSGTSGQLKIGDCNLSGIAEYMQRGGKFYPLDKTANFLVTGQCKPQDWP